MRLLGVEQIGRFAVRGETIDFTEEIAGLGDLWGERRIDREALHVAEEGPADPHQAARSLGGVKNSYDLGVRLDGFVVRAVLH